LKHKLLLVNLLLLALVAASGSVLRQKWRESKARQAKVMNQKAAPVPPPAIAPIPPVPPASIANYVDVALKLVTSKDRNPNVIIDPPAPKPPPVMPPLPFQYGVIDFGAGPTVLLAEKSGGQQHGFRLGDKVGPFKLLGVNRTDILFEWEGKPVQKKLADLVDKNANAAAERAAAEAPKTAPGGAAAAPVAPAEPKPGKSMGADAKACQPGDNSPAGTVADGFKKVVTASPFGQVCRWEPTK
jgi:hypothetical protein